MKNIVSKLSKESLVYFFVLGFVVFGLHAFLNSEMKVRDEDPFTVEVASADVEWIRSSWETRMKRQPTQLELQGLINNYIREEILQREALAMGMDEKDMIIKRRLVQKLTFVFEDLAETMEPTDDELKNYMQENQEKYRIPEMMSFTHIYFDPDKSKEVVNEAKTVLDRLKSAESPSEKILSLGDVIMMDASFRKKSPDEVARIFGKEFTDELFSASKLGWQGPIISTYGLHIVFIEERIASQMPAFDNIREDVKIDFVYERKKQVIDNAYNTAKSRYTVLVEGLPYE